MATKVITTPFPYTFNGEDFDYWSSLFEVWLKVFDLWKIVDEGFDELEDEVGLSEAHQRSLKANRKKDIDACNQINIAIEKAVNNQHENNQNSSNNNSGNNHHGAEDKKNDAVLIHENSKETLLLTCYGDDIDDVWYLDSGASKHVTGNKNLFSNLSMMNHGQVKIGDARAYKIELMGEVVLRAKSGKIEKMFDVFYVSRLKNNLLSVGLLLRKGFNVPFPNLASFDGVDDSISKLLDESFGHLNYGSLKLMSTKNMVEGLLRINQVNEVCEACQLGKQHRDPFPSQSS
ncbi:hypothetical protein EZV62_027914 [Acer yangbiense]|uniref:GAG-pre-integrase domain-containing protein n=1 Tax=Acer yangbiense TaxID=1000413 RepID=A0A5C7GPS2_9ROSI|nr:hypothetical protein EZV62_027914 [Acer yangbiense]